MNKKIAFLGAGNMSGAILQGLLNSGVDPTLITATNRSSQRQAHWSSLGVQVTSCNQTASQNADIIVLGVKPAMIDELLCEIQASVRPNCLVITVAAGVPMSNYEYRLPNHAIARVMPNTPCLVQQGVSGIFTNSHVDAKQQQTVEALFAPLGEIFLCEQESDIDRVIAVAGSAPAYHFLFLEAIIEAGEALGLNHEDAKRMAIKTALGAATMALQSTEDIAQLRANVTSPGGTTAQAIAHFEAADLRNIVKGAMDDCVARAKDMEQLLTIDRTAE